MHTDAVSRLEETAAMPDPMAAKLDESGKPKTRHRRPVALEPALERERN